MKRKENIGKIILQVKQYKEIIKSVCLVALSTDVDIRGKKINPSQFLNIVQCSLINRN